MRYAIFTMVGPGETDARRLRTLLRGLFRHEPDTPLLVIVNDTGGRLPDLAGLVPSSCRLVELHQQKRLGIHGIAHNTLLALRELAKRQDNAIDFAMKLDTDALVIGPFAKAIGDFFAANPAVGQVGKAERACDGSATDFGVYVPFVRRLKRRIQIWRSPKWGVAQAFFGDSARARKLVFDAAQNGVDAGRHCQGGSYAVSQAALAKLDAAGLLNDAYARVFGLAEDLMVSTIIAAGGFQIASLTAPGDPFGVEPTGLPFLPEELRAKGYGIIHSIKNDRRVSEAEIVKFFGLDV